MPWPCAASSYYSTFYAITHLFVEDDAEVAPADSGIRELHEVRPSKHGRLLASTDTPALGDAKGLVIPVRIRWAQALPRQEAANGRGNSSTSVARNLTQNVMLASKKSVEVRVRVLVALATSRGVLQHCLYWKTIVRCAHMLCRSVSELSGLKASHKIFAKELSISAERRQL